MTVSWFLLLPVGIIAVTLEQFIHLSQPDSVSKKARPPLVSMSPRTDNRDNFNRRLNGLLAIALCEPYSAFNTKTGQVLGKTAERHTSAEFVAFLTDIVVNQPKGRKSTSLDNLSAHKTARVQTFLPEHPNVHLHFTPTIFLAQSGRTMVRQDSSASSCVTSASTARPKNREVEILRSSCSISAESVVPVH